MAKPQQIIAKAQADLLDISGISFMEGELVDLFNETIQEVARETQLWINVLKYTVTEDNVSDPSTNAVRCDKVFAVYRKSVQQHTLREIPYLALKEAELNTYRNPTTNAVRPNDAYAVTILSNGASKIDFLKPLQVGEEIEIHYMTTEPVIAVTYSTADANIGVSDIPDFLAETIKLGIIYRLMQKRYAKGNDSYRVRTMDFEMFYRKELMRQLNYTRELKTATQSTEIQPYRL